MTVLIVGAGGLGCPAAYALAAAGVPLAIADDDRVDVSNLHRQILHRTADVGRMKVESAVEALRRRFPALPVEGLPIRLDAGNARGVVSRFSVVLDGTDSVESKFVLNDACVAAGVPLVHGGVVGWSGQLMSVVPDGPCYRCLFEAPPESTLATCAADGVLGPVAGVIGGWMADEALRILEGNPELSGSIRIWDAKSDTTRTVQFRRRPDCEACGNTRREAA
jgi:molybdopterin-synthase adenylyltransferase